MRPVPLPDNPPPEESTGAQDPADARVSPSSGSPTSTQAISHAYTVKGLLPHRLAVIYGPPKCGKTFLAFDMLLHVALGWEYRRKRVSQGTIVYCALEGALGFEKRIVAFRRDKLKDEAAEPAFYLMSAPLSLQTDHANFIAGIKKQIGNSDEKPSVVYIDTLNRSLEGSKSPIRT